MLGGHWSGASGDIKYLICHVTSQSYVIEGSCNFMSASSSLYVMTLPNLVAIGIIVVEVYFWWLKGKFQHPLALAFCIAKLPRFLFKSVFMKLITFSISRSRITQNHQPFLKVKTLKSKLILLWKLSEFCLCHQLFVSKDLCVKTSRISLKIQLLWLWPRQFSESPYKVLQIPWKYLP